MSKTEPAETPEKPLSYPKNRIKVLLLENIDPVAAEAFTTEGYHVEELAGSLSEQELCTRLADVHLLGIRSHTKLTPSVLSAGRHLLGLGAFCIGTNQIDLAAACRGGTAVFNAPFSNTRSVVELALGEIIMLMRRTFDRATEMQAGVWKKIPGGSHELRGKRLGIVGYGHIGSQLSVLAEAMGMQVVYYDVADRLPFGNARAAATLTELLASSDVVTVHVDGRPENRNLIGQAEFAQMRPGTIFLNLSRGFIVDDHALAAALQGGRLAGAAADVFPAEPGAGEPFSSPLRGLPNVILTPHVASGTEEAQRNIGRFVSEKLISFINTGDTTLSVNLPNLRLPKQTGHHRLLHIHRNEPGVLARVNSILAATGANISGQYLGTAGDIGYVITDINREYSHEAKTELSKLRETIRVRLLY